jgi:hypothetical protein
VKIVYYPAGSREFASSRLRVWKVADALRKLGIDATVNLSNKPSSPRPDVAVYQKRFDQRLLMQFEREMGVTIIWDCDDMIPDGPVDLADVVTVDTPFKRSLYPMAEIVPDCLDVDEAAAFGRLRSAWQRLKRDRIKRVAWVGNVENLYHAAHVATACKQLGIELVCITDIGSLKFSPTFDATYIQWQLDTVDQVLGSCDVAACSYIVDSGAWSADWVLAKSANRVLKAWALGLSVIGTPIPSYIGIGVKYQAATTDEWIAALEALQPRTARIEDAQRGLEIARQFRAENVARQWMEVMTCPQKK